MNEIECLFQEQRYFTAVELCEKLIEKIYFSKTKNSLELFYLHLKNIECQTFANTHKIEWRCREGYDEIYPQILRENLSVYFENFF